MPKTETVLRVTEGTCRRLVLERLGREFVRGQIDVTEEMVEGGQAVTRDRTIDVQALPLADRLVLAAAFNTLELTIRRLFYS